VPLSPPGPVPALPAIYIYYLLPIYNRSLTTSPYQCSSASTCFLGLPTPPNGVVAPSKTLRISGKNTASCFALDAHRIENPVSANWIFYRGKCTRVCQYLHRVNSGDLTTGIITEGKHHELIHA